MRRRRENFEFYDITNRISSAKTVFLKAFWSVFGVETHGNISKFSGPGQDYDLTPPLLKNVKIQGGGVKYKGGGLSTRNWIDV